MKISPRALTWLLSSITLLQLMLLPLFCYFVLISLMISDNPSINYLMFVLVMLMMLCLPLSVPISLYFMWTRRKIDPKKALIFAALPLYVMVGIFILSFAIDKLQLIQ